MTGITPGRVAPFGHLGIIACVPLPRASRSLPRPSSPPCAQASPTCLPSLDYITQPSRSTRIAFTSDVFLAKKSSQFGFFQIPRSTRLPLSNSADPQGQRPRGRQSRVERQNVSKRSDLREPFPRHSRAGLLGSVKEVIQPQVPLRLPCYDFAPVTALAFGRLPPGYPGLRHGLRALTASMA